MLHNDDPKAKELFDQEAKVLAQLDNPGIPHVRPGNRFDFYPRNSAQGLPCLVMEYIEGENLQDYLRQRDLNGISERAALKWLRELLEILDLAHGANYFHRDIKPANVMVRNSGSLALIDFGTARAETQTYLQKQAGKKVTSVISVGYTPHEQINGQADYRSDFFCPCQNVCLFTNGLRAGAFYR